MVNEDIREGAWSVRRKNDAIEVKFGMDIEHVRSVLTADVSVEECIFDLIDNSIDASRNAIYARKKIEVDKNGLPKSYHGFHVSLELGESSILVVDNCTGMSLETLKNESLYTGAKEFHPYGIGFYGVGLLRAVLKLCNAMTLITDNGRTAYELEMSEERMLNLSDTNALLAVEIPSQGKPFNKILFKNIPIECSTIFRSTDLLNDLKNKISVRYAIFIEKGFSISVNSEQCKNLLPKFLVGGYRNKKKKVLSNGVAVYTDVGYHEKYPLNIPNKSASSDVVSQCGWYVACNDRVIKVADKDSFVKWHGEYNGMLFWTHYISKNPSLLPWDSKKSDFNVNSTSFLEPSPWFAELASEFRTVNRGAKGKSGVGYSASSSSGVGAGSSSDATSNASTHEARTRSSAKIKNGHNKDWHCLIPSHVSTVKDNKLSSLIVEAKALRIDQSPYAATFLYRSLIERALFCFISEKGEFHRLRNELLAEQEKERGKPFSDTARKLFKPGLKNYLEWILSNIEWFPIAKRKDVKNACDKYIGALKVINGVVHEGELTNSNILRNVRDTTYYFFEALVDDLKR